MRNRVGTWVLLMGYCGGNAIFAPQIEMPDTMTREMFFYSLLILLLIATIVFVILYVKWKFAYKKLLKKSLQRPEQKFELIETASFLDAKGEGAAEERLLKDLYRLFVEEKVFLNQDLSLNELAKRLGVNKATLSHTINMRMNRNFPTLLNEYRIEEAVQLLTDKKTGSYKMEVIGEMCGYRNRQVFHSAFKRETGLTPVQFRELMTNEQERG